MPRAVFVGPLTTVLLICFRELSSITNDFYNLIGLQAEGTSFDFPNDYNPIEETNYYSTIMANCLAKPNPFHGFEQKNSEEAYKKLDLEKK